MGTMLGLVTTVMMVVGAPESPVRPEGTIKESVETLPAHRGGQDLVGTQMPKLAFDRWLSGKDAEQSKESGVTLYRWWTNTCPFCEASLPAVEKLRKKYGKRGLRVVAVYHPKPPRAVSDEEIKRLATRFGYDGVLAVDADWSVLGDFYLSTGRRRATSVSFLVDAAGVIRFVHPGPVFFPSSDPKAKVENADYLLLDEAIDRLLDEVKSNAKDRAPRER